MNSLNNVGQQPIPQQAKIQINPNDLPTIPCKNEDCKKEVYIQTFVFKRVSKIISQTGKEQIVSAVTFVCAGCGLGFGKEPVEVKK